MGFVATILFHLPHRDKDFLEALIKTFKEI